MPRGKTIKLFLIDGEPSGRIKCSLTNWTGIAYKIPRTALDKCKDLDILKQSGVYFLFGTDKADNAVVYIGQAGVRKNISVENPQVRIGRNTKDFGTGFYCTVIKEQAQRWAKRYDTKVVSIYEVRLNLDLNIKEFQEMTEEWLDFIIDCRSGKSHNYDIVIGAMADDQIYNYISDYIEGVITRDQFWSLAKFKYPTHQINFCTEKALKCLEYRGFEEVV